MFSVRILASVVVASMVFSGCTSGTGTSESIGDGTLDPTASEPVGPPGDLNGVVVDDSFHPLSGADVVLLNTEPLLSRRTDPEGRFEFVGLPAGKYRVAAQLYGYSETLRDVLVESSAAAEVTLALTALAAPGTGRHNTIIEPGYISCSVTVDFVTVGTLCSFDAQHKPRVKFDVAREALQGVLQEITWTPSVPETAKRLTVYLQLNVNCTPALCNAERTWPATAGPSPVRRYTDLAKDAPALKHDPLPLYSTITPTGSYNSGEYVGVVWQQRIEHYLTTFHEVPGATNFTALP